MDNCGSGWTQGQPYLIFQVRRVGLREAGQAEGALQRGGAGRGLQEHAPCKNKKENLSEIWLTVVMVNRSKSLSFLSMQIYFQIMHDHTQVEVIIPQPVKKCQHAYIKVNPFCVTQTHINLIPNLNIVSQTSTPKFVVVGTEKFFRESNNPTNTYIFCKASGNNYNAEDLCSHLSSNQRY